MRGRCARPWPSGSWRASEGVRGRSASAAGSVPAGAGSVAGEGSRPAGLTSADASGAVCGCGRSRPPAGSVAAVGGTPRGGVGLSPAPIGGRRAPRHRASTVGDAPHTPAGPGRTPRSRAAAVAGGVSPGGPSWLRVPGRSVGARGRECAPPGSAAAGGREWPNPLSVDSQRLGCGDGAAQARAHLHPRTHPAGGTRGGIDPVHAPRGTACCLFRRGCRILEVWSLSGTSRASGKRAEGEGAGDECRRTCS